MFLVTGADGIVGRAVCKELQFSGKLVKPVIRKRLPISSEEALVIDLATAGALDDLVGGEIEAVVHLAAAVPHSLYYPDTEVSADITRRIDSSILEFAARLNIPVVYMSTCGLYDRSIEGVKNEDDKSLVRIESPYFSAKFDGEKMFLSHPKSPILRLAAPIGPGLKPSVVVSKFIMAARSEEPIAIWGSGKREQNFIDVRDVASLILKVLDNPRSNIINVAAESPITMQELARQVIEVVGRGTFTYSGNSDPRDGETARYSISKAQDLYGWRPKYDILSSIGLVVTENFESN